MLIVQKYGGTSVGTPERIQQVADRIAERNASGDRVVAVVSAMGQTTDELSHLARRITERPSRREMDMLLTAGERITMALLSMALNTRGIPAISFTGSQSGIITDTAHTRARILEIRPIRIGPELERGRVVIVAGFQGVSREKEVTTLGRGGSDTTAVALAVGLGAGSCQIMTDVPGVMTADPRLVSRGRLLPRVSWETMLELSCCGAGVMHSRAVEVARRHRMRFEVRSTFEEREGTVVEGTPIEAGPLVAAITGWSEVVQVRLNGLDRERAGTDLMSTVDALFDEIAGLHLYEEEDRAQLVFHVPVLPEGRETLDRLQETAREYGGTLGAQSEFAAVSLVGTGTLDAPEIASRAGHALAAAGIRIYSLTTGNLSLTLLVPRNRFAEAQKTLHAEFLETG